MTENNTIEHWRLTAPNTLDIDWAGLEKALGFPLHDNFKDFYSRITANVEIEGRMTFDPSKFVKEYVSAEDGWLDEANGDRKQCEFTLLPLKETGSEHLRKLVNEAFFGEWTGGNDFGHRAYIGELILNISQISLVFNNDTGAFEWVDFEYGYYEVYEENPYGIVANSAQEFLDKFKT